MVEKDMKTVADYNYEEKLKFLRGMAFNNAATLLASRKYENVNLTPANVFDLAESLFDEAIKRNWINYGTIKDNRVINPIDGKVEVVMTEKEGRVMDPQLQEEEQELVI